jgi:hypothetical protein
MNPHHPPAVARLDSHTQRVRWMILLSSWPSILIGSGWGIFFAWSGAWGAATSDALLTLAGIAALRMLAKGKIRVASIVLVASLLLRIAGMALFLDVPDAHAPRSMQNFLIPLGVASYLMLKHEKPWLRDGLSWSCLACAVVLSSSDLAFARPYSLDPTIRVPGTWFNNIASAGLLLMMLHLFVTDINQIKASTRRYGRLFLRWTLWWLPARWQAPARDFETSLAPTDEADPHRIGHSETRSWQLAQERRVRLMILTGSATLIGLGATGALVAVVLSSPVLLATDIAVVAVGLAWVRRHGDAEKRGALMSSIVLLMALIALLACTIDVPRPGLARSVHYFLLPISSPHFSCCAARPRARASVCRC